MARKKSRCKLIGNHPVTQYNTIKSTVPPAGSCGTAKDRMDRKEKDIKCYDWFFCTKPISKDEVMKKVLKKK